MEPVSVAELKCFSSIEREMQILIRNLDEELQIEKLPKKIKESPKLIHFLESLQFTTQQSI